MRRVKRAPRVVLDTNVFMAARFNPGSSSAQILTLCVKGRCIPLLSWKLRREIESILKRTKAGGEFDRKFGKLLKQAKTVRVERELPLVMEDPDDNKFLNCALFGKADYLVTSDDHLLKLGEYLGIKICKPSKFLRSIGRPRGRRRKRVRRPETER